MSRFSMVAMDVDVTVVVAQIVSINVKFNKLENHSSTADMEPDRRTTGLCQ